MDRRDFLQVAAAGLWRLPFGLGRTPDSHRPSRVVAELQRRTFHYFRDTTSPQTGLAPDRWPTPSTCSIAAVGFALNAWPIGVEQGWIGRAEARQRARNTLRFLLALPQGPQAMGVAGQKGFFYHQLDIRTGLRAPGSELSTIDTTLMLGGVLFCRNYFDAQTPEEADIRDAARQLYERIDWPWAIRHAPLVSMGFVPESGWIAGDWKGYNEAMLLYLLALGSPTHPAPAEAWAGWTASYDEFWRTLYGQEHLTFPPLFGHQYSHVWVDFRQVQDAFMRRKGIDYFENSRRATLAQKAYAAANPGHWSDYGGDIWGLTACDGPGYLTLETSAGRQKVLGYSARGIGSGEDDGTIAPTAAAASLPFAPSEASAAIEAMSRIGNGALWTPYGFPDAFNPSIRSQARFQKGQWREGFGWVDQDFLGIDQGPILAMIENHRSGLIWSRMRKDPDLRRGLVRAGFTGGWLGKA